VKKAGERHGVTVRTKVLRSINLEEDVAQTAQHYICDMIIIGANAQAEEHLAVITPVIPRTHSIPDMLDMGIDTLVGGGSPIALVIARSLKDVHGQLGIFISKVPSPVALQKVAFLYNGLPYESSAYETILKINPGVNVDVYVPQNASEGSEPYDFDREAHPNINVIIADEPVQTLLGALRQVVYDLVIVASQRAGASPAISELVREANLNILMIFPPSPLNSTPFREDEESKTIA